MGRLSKWRVKCSRRTGRALFARIRISGYAGGHARVTDFIRAWRASAGKDAKAFVPLQQHPSRLVSRPVKRGRREACSGAGRGFSQAPRNSACRTGVEFVSFQRLKVLLLAGGRRLNCT